MNRLLISANHARVRVLCHQEAGPDPIAQPHWLEDSQSNWQQSTPPLREQVSDQAGRFAQGCASDRLTGMSYGEEHDLKREIDSKALKQVAKHIESVLHNHHWPRWTLAAPRSILPSLKQSLSPVARKHLQETVGADLTRCPLMEIEERFPG